MKYTPLHLLVVFAVCGCHRSALIASKDDLHMDAPSQKREQLTIGQSTLPVTVEQSVANGTVTLTIAADGEQVESEQYSLTNSELQLQTGSDATFQPPLPILRIPSEPGQSWTWNGTMQEGKRTRQARATVATSSKTLELGASPDPCLISEVHLSIDNGTPVPAQRVLTFWFDKNGLVKREFGMGTTRTDAAPVGPEASFAKGDPGASSNDNARK